MIIPVRMAFAFAAGLLFLGVPGCGQGPVSPPPSGSRGSVTALVAASTQDAIRESATGFTAETGIEVKLNSDDSSKLATQIVNGAPADLFLSANEKWAEFVQAKGFALETVSLLGNGLVIIVPRGNPARIAQPKDLARPAVKRLALAGPTVPAGIYARQALTKLDLWRELDQANKIIEGENVRVALTYVERGEAEAGIVYATDATISNRVEVVSTFAAGVHEPIVYPLILLKAGEQNEAAQKFYAFLRSPRAAEIFRKYGFRFLVERQQ